MKNIFKQGTRAKKISKNIKRNKMTKIKHINYPK